MITNKDIRVENGSLILNGDPYPLDGQSPETIMQIVEDNSDTTPTENSDAPITSGGVYTALAGKEDTLIFDTTPTDESTNPVTSAGIKTYVNTIIGNLILSENSTSAIAVNETYQIPTAMMSKNIIVLSVNRAGTCGSIALPTFQITQGSCASGIKIVAGYGTDPTTDIFAVLTISTTGLITVSNLSNWSPVYIVLKAI